jgi:hypothetical protein
MSNVDDFLTGLADEADAAMGTKVMVCSGQTFNVVWNEGTLDLDGVLGGLENQRTGTAVAQAADVTSPLTLINKQCTVGTETWRVDRVIVGDVVVTFNLIGADE